MKILLVIAIILAGAVAQDEGWIEPYFEIIDDSKITDFSQKGNQIKFTMKEDVEIDFKIGNFLYTGDGILDLNGLPDDKSYFTIDQDQKILKTIKEVDYESDKNTFKIAIIVKKFELEFEITLSNVNDEPVLLNVYSPVPCKHDENKKGVSNCQFKISDIDGIDPSIHFSFLINENEAKSRFKMNEDYSDLIGKFEAVVTLEFLQEENFETENKIILNWIAEDYIFNDTQLITIHINDVADMPPEWITLLGSIEIDELQAKTISLEARDGDLVVQSPIEYEIQCKTKSLCSEKLKINGDNIEISPISLADSEENSILFQLIARETLDPNEETLQSVALLIKDINDHDPEININKGKIEIDEHYNKPLDVEIKIEDKDSGDFGTYEVSLTSNLENLEITNIFQIIPSTGYKKGSLTLSILNPSLLDYDDTDNLDLHDFQITIHSKDNTKNPDPSKSNTDEKTISITVKNLNDEIPVWASSTGYELELFETYGRYENEQLKTKDNFYAVDDDIGAFGEVSYEIVGAASQKILKLVNPNPAKEESIKLETIPIPNGQIFDFEYQQDVLVSILAKDNDVDNQHLVVTQLTIKVLDVNDELPVLSSTAQTATIEEDTEDADVLKDIVFTVTDADSKPNLDIIVDWEKTYGVKLGEILTTEFEQYKGLFTFKVQRNTKDKQKIVATLELDLSKPLLDYRVLDTIYLFILATDKNGEEPHSQTAETTLIINIANINNKAPEFETISEMQVKENSDVTIVGIVRALDPDNLDKITYKLEPENGSLEIQDDGKIVVKDGSKIEADPDIYFLKYKVTAFDSKYNTSKDIEIEIIDVNDNNPNYNLEPQYFMEEHSIPNFDLISVTDIDRDGINKNFECLVKDENFKVISKENLGCQIELIPLQVIDRDGPNGKSSIELTLNVHNHQALVPNTVTQIFKIKVKDINDNSPEIKPGIILQANENDEVNSEIAGTIEFEDIDEGENANVVEYKLVEIEQEGTSKSKLLPTHFEFIRINEQAVKLKLVKSIKDCYGDYNLHIVGKDNGSPKLESVKDIPVKLHIEKYNSHPVIFVNAPDQILLKKVQEVNAPLELWSGGSLDPIQASDQQEGKYEIQFNFVDESGSVVEHDFFRLGKEGSDKVNLMLKTLTNLGARYTIRMSANSIDAIPPTKEAYHEMNILFLDTDAAPVFNEDAPACKIDEDYIGKLPCVLPKASYIPTSFKFPRQDEFGDIFYHILKEQSMPEDAYKIEDNLKNEVSVILELDIVKYDEAYFTVEASPSDKPSAQPSENSLLRVTLERIEVNNHPPVFDKDEASSLGIMLIGMIIGDKLMSVKATDPDHDQITYTITSYKADESLPAESTEPLFVSDGDLKLNFKVQSHMTGRIECTITAFDGKYNAKKDVELYVISDIHLTSIVFENELAIVQDSEDDIKTIFQEYFKYRVGIRSIYEVGGSTYEEATTSSTEVIAYFIDTDKKVGIEKEEIQSKMNNIAFYAQLRDAFVKVSLLLKNVIIGAEEESLEETYKIALIIVSAVSGVLLIGLIGFFTYKIRSQNSRLDRMDQAEARRPTMIQAPNLPGANRRATQVFNPNIKQEKEFEEKDDLSFTNSPRASSFRDPFDDDDDEDFVGVENNDIFKINPSKA